MLKQLLASICIVLLSIVGVRIGLAGFNSGQGGTPLQFAELCTVGVDGGSTDSCGGAIQPYAMVVVAVDEIPRSRDTLSASDAQRHLTFTQYTVSAPGPKPHRTSIFVARNGGSELTADEVTVATTSKFDRATMNVAQVTGPNPPLGIGVTGEVSSTSSRANLTFTGSPSSTSLLVAAVGLRSGEKHDGFSEPSGWASQHAVSNEAGRSYPYGYLDVTDNGHPGAATSYAWSAWGAVNTLDVVAVEILAGGPSPEPSPSPSASAAGNPAPSPSVSVSPTASPSPSASPGQPSGPPSGTPSPPGRACPTGNRPVKVNGPNGVPNSDDYQTNNSGENFEAGTGANAVHFPVQSNSSQDVQTWLNQTSGTGGNCWYGGIMQGNNLSMTWSQLKACCNAWFWAAGQGSGSEPTAGQTWSHVVGDDPDEDAWHLLGVIPAYTILDSQVTNVRDECFSTAHDDLTVDNTYCQGWTITSWRNTGGGAGQPFHVTMNGDVFWLKKQLEGAETSCQGSETGGYGHGLMWKMDSFQGSGSDITVTNTVFRVDSNQSNSTCLAWPVGNYSGDLIFYTGSGAYNGQVPAGVTVSTNINDWYRAVDRWCSTHWTMDYSSQTACDSALDN